MWQIMMTKRMILKNMRNSCYKAVQLQKISFMTNSLESREKIKKIQDKEYKKWKFYKKLSEVMDEQNK